MTTRERSRAASVVFGTAAVLLLAGIAALTTVRVTEDGSPARLPLVMRIPQAELSDLPVAIDRVYSCSCFDGPRGQIQRKYKFKVVNGYDDLIDIGGGERSQT